MARGRGGRGAGSSRSSKSRQTSGIEKYGKDEVDEVLRLDEDDDAASEEDSLEDGCEEEDVMALEDDDAELAPRGAPAEEEEDEDDKEATAVASKGWKRHEFYGGDDVGDESDAGSDEDLIYEEARRLEQLRAKQLGGEEDVLASLLGSPVEQTAVDDAAEDDLVKAVAGASAASAQFESVFAAEAEHDTVPRDLAQLPAEDRRSLMKKEAPELLPLLGDFKAKIAGLRELLPLLRPLALKRMPASGASYLEAKASLLLNTLANLSFYLLLRAQGGAVRSHPVVPQLVWLRELHEQLAPLDKKLGPKMRQAVGIAERLRQSTTLASEGRETKAGAPAARAPDEEPKKLPSKASLRDRVERLRLAASQKDKDKPQSRTAKAAAQDLPATEDLLRLPKVKRSGKGSSASRVGDAPLDLDEVDPSLGAWLPKASVAEQLSAVKQQLRHETVKAKAGKMSGDLNIEARPRRTRERLSLEPDAPADEAAGGPPGDIQDDDHPDLIKQALEASRAKKERKAKGEEAREEQRRLRQYQPEEVKDGRRKTSKKILDNRGLVRVRKKYAGNARVSNKKKYEKKVKRRRGAVQDMREGAGDGGYDGETTGIRTHLRKSTRIS